MQSSRQDIDTEILSTHYKTISFKASSLELWDRSALGKSIGIRMQSMLPQINFNSKAITTLTNSIRQNKVGFCTASKYSKTHYLSLYANDCIWTEYQNLPKSDYLIYLKATNIRKIIDHLSHEEKLLENFLSSLEKIIARHSKLEVLDLCRTVIMFTKDKVSSKFLLRCEILFPYINLLFTPISPIKLVSSSLTKELITSQASEFSNGFLTMDQNSRVVPLKFEDPNVLKYPIIGI